MRIFTGITDKELKKEFLKQPNKDYKTLLEVADTYEMGRRYDNSMKSQAAAVAANFVSGQGKGQKKTTKGSGKKDEGKKAMSTLMYTLKKENKCFRCGGAMGDDRSEHLAKCRAKELNCKACGKTGHTKAVCFNPTSETTSNVSKKKTAKKADSDDTEEEATYAPDSWHIVMELWTALTMYQHLRWK